MNLFRFVNSDKRCWGLDLSHNRFTISVAQIEQSDRCVYVCVCVSETTSPLSLTWIYDMLQVLFHVATSSECRANYSTVCM